MPRAWQAARRLEPNFANVRSDVSDRAGVLYEATSAIESSMRDAAGTGEPPVG